MLPMPSPFDPELASKLLSKAGVKVVPQFFEYEHHPQRNVDWIEKALFQFKKELGCNTASNNCQIMHCVWEAFLQIYA